ncbi:MAG: hypothetical protein V8S22_07365 [Lachnospiraceae bacterium]
MRKKMLKNASFLVIVAVFLSFLTASLVMYEKVREAVKSGIRDEAEYVRTLMDAQGTGRKRGRLSASTVGQTTANPITLEDPEGTVLYQFRRRSGNHGKSCGPSGICGSTGKWLL